MVYMIFMGIISLFVAIFALQNAAAVEVSFLFWHTDMSLALVILGCLIAGFILASLWTLKVKTGHFMKERKLKKQIQTLEEKKQAWEQDREAFRREHFSSKSEFKGGKFDAAKFDPKKDTDPLIKPFKPVE